MDVFSGVLSFKTGTLGRNRIKLPTNQAADDGETTNQPTQRRLSQVEYDEIVGRQIDVAKAGPAIDITDVSDADLRAFLRLASG